MDVTHKNGSQPPQRIARQTMLGMHQYIITFDVQNLIDDTTGIEEYTWTEAVALPGIPSYEALVAAIVKSRYSDDAMYSLINNHLLGDGDATHEAEWNAMQEWRAKAKEFAKEVIQEIAEQYEK